MTTWARGIAWGLSLCLLACGGGTADGEDPGGDHARPNVLFISIDDLRPELGAYGEATARSPWLDAFAGTALRFDRAYCQVALCNPSRASVMTGLRPRTTQVVGLKRHFRETLPDAVTLPQAFRAAGYRCASMGKVYHNQLLDPPSWTEEPYLPPRARRYALPKSLEGAGPRSKGPSIERADVEDAAYRDGLVTERAVAFLEDPGDAPFFLALGFYKPHLPLAAPTGDFDEHPLEGVAAPLHADPPRDAPPFALLSSGELEQYRDVPNDGVLAEKQARELIQAYRACVTFVDRQVGEVLQALERSGAAKNTIVVIWSDHGWYLGEHGRWAKGGVAELGLRTPLFVRGPGAGGGKSTDALVELVDLYPTLCELAGVEVPGTLQGTSFADLVAGEASRVERNWAFSEHHGANGRAFSVRSADWRATVWMSADGRTERGVELYHYPSDPHEDVNVASDPEHADVLAAHRAALRGQWPELIR